MGVRQSSVENYLPPDQRRRFILEVLRAESWMTTRQIWERVPEEVRVYEYDCPNLNNHNAARKCVHAQQVFAYKIGEQSVYQDLVTLEGQDLVRRELRHVEGSTPKRRPKAHWRSKRPGEDEDEAIASIVFGRLMA